MFTLKKKPVKHGPSLERSRRYAVREGESNAMLFSTVWFSLQKCPFHFLRRNSNVNLEALSAVLSRVGLALTALFPRRFRQKKSLNSVL